MKKLISIFLFLFMLPAWALEVDPGEKPTFTITCDYPTEREDGTALTQAEIAQINFYVSTDQSTWTPAGFNTSACRQVYDLSQIADGQYYYAATTIDTAGRESIRSMVVDLLVKRSSDPNPPANLQGTATNQAGQQGLGSP